MLLQSINLFNTPNNTGIKKNFTTTSSSYPNLAPLRQDTVSFSGGIPKSVDLMDLPPDKIIKICKIII